MRPLEDPGRHDRLPGLGEESLNAVTIIRLRDIRISRSSERPIRPRSNIQCAVPERAIPLERISGPLASTVRKDGGNDGVTLAGCWAHSRRKFYELHVAKSSKVATETDERMAELWEIEDTVRGQSPGARVAARQERAAEIVRDLFALWQTTLLRVTPARTKQT